MASPKSKVAPPKGPTTKTVKQLFGLSSNQCAFPDCRNPIIDHEAGVVVGKIAHIRASSVGGPRYDDTQTPEKRHGFANLILLCGPHHDVVDDKDNVQHYTVEILESMKTTHEGKASAAEESYTEDAAEALLAAYWQTTVHISQTASHSTAMVFTGPATIGANSAEVVEIFLRLYAENAPKLVDEAARTAEERVKAVSLGVTKRMIENELVDALRDPDFLSAANEALRCAARRGGQDLPKMLIDLVADRARVTMTKDEYKGIVLNEAIAVTAKLMPDQLDALSLLFMIGSTVNFGVRTLPTLRLYIETHLCPFMDGASKSSSRFQHLVYCGCGSIGLGQVPLRDRLKSTYPICFGAVVKEAVLLKTLGPDWAKVRSAFSQVPGTDEFQCKFSLEQLDVEEGRRRTLAKAYTNAARVPEDLTEIHPRLVELATWWDGTPAKHFRLTSVGIALAHANLRVRGIPDGFDLGIWVN